MDSDTDEDDDEEPKRKWPRRKPMICRISQFGRVMRPNGCVFTPAANPVYGYVGFKASVAGKYERNVRIPVHRLVQVLFNDPDLQTWQPGDTVDHVDRNKFNNRSENLRWASKAEQNLNRDTSRPKLMSCPVVATFLQEPFHPSVTFPTVKDAAKEMNLRVMGINLSCKGVCKQTGGVAFAYKEFPDLDGEKWVLVPDGRPGQPWKMSNMGRLQNPAGMKEYPRVGPMGYAQFRHRQFHVVLMEVMGPPKPSEEHSVDHINRDKSDNRLVNLRWATCVEQGMNRKAISIPTLEWNVLEGEEWRDVNFMDWCVESGKYWPTWSVFRTVLDARE